ncbi:hypothetical protein ACLOJK_003894 [Asimina triloba]
MPNLSQSQPVFGVDDDTEQQAAATFIFSGGLRLPQRVPAAAASGKQLLVRISEHNISRACLNTRSGDGNSSDHDNSKNLQIDGEQRNAQIKISGPPKSQSFVVATLRPDPPSSRSTAISEQGSSPSPENSAPAIDITWQPLPAASPLKTTCMATTMAAAFP